MVAAYNRSNKLRHAIKKMHCALEQLRLKTHPDKTFIGRREKGFSFLGYHFCNQELTIAEVAFQNHQAKCLRLQEQQAPIKRLVDYGRRWLGWFTAGVDMGAGYAESVKLGLVFGGSEVLVPRQGLRAPL
jgi:hypothetical protein